MSVTVVWRPVKPGKDVGKLALKELLERAFGGFPMPLGRDDLVALRVIERVQTSPELREGIEEITAAIQRHGEIELTAEY